MRQAGELHRDVQAVGDHRDGERRPVLQRSRDFGGRRARVEDDRVVLGHQLHRRVGDAHLLVVVQGFLDGQAEIALVEALDRAAVRAHEAAAIGELVEVAPDGDGRHGELTGEVVDRRPLVRVEQLEDPSTPFFDEKLRHCPGGRVGAAVKRPPPDVALLEDGSYA